MKVRFWLIGFLIWVLVDYQWIRFFVPTFVESIQKYGVGDGLRYFLNLTVFAFQLFPLSIIAMFILTFVQICIFSYLSNETWFKLQRWRVVKKLKYRTRRRIKKLKYMSRKKKFSIYLGLSCLTILVVTLFGMSVLVHPSFDVNEELVNLGEELKREFIIENRNWYDYKEFAQFFMWRIFEMNWTNFKISLKHYPSVQTLYLDTTNRYLWYSIFGKVMFVHY